MKGEDGGWLDDSLMDLFTDILNFLCGTYKSDQEEPLPSIVCMKHLQFDKLWCLSDTNQNYPTINSTDPFFIQNLKKSILDGHLKNNLASIMHLYLTRQNREDKPLSKVLSVMNISNTHFIQTTVDISNRSVIKRDSISKFMDFASYRRY